MFDWFLKILFRLWRSIVAKKIGDKSNFDKRLSDFGSFLVIWSLLYNGCSQKIWIYSRRPVPSTDQALPSCFYFRISWIIMEQRCSFCFFGPLGFLKGLRSLKHWLLKKLSMKNFDQKYKFLIKKNWHFDVLIYSEREIFDL